eukprot:scaffold1061_cov213-Prasinococcus_capsulatus_cf.AAC.13
MCKRGVLAHSHSFKISLVRNSYLQPRRIAEACHANKDQVAFDREVVVGIEKQRMARVLLASVVFQLSQGSPFLVRKRQAS